MPQEPPSLAQELLTALVAVNLGRLKSGYAMGSVSLDWQLGEDKVVGSFELPLRKRLDPQTGALIIEAADFIQAKEEQ